MTESPRDPRPQVLLVGGTHPKPIVAMLEARGCEVSWWSGQRHDEFRRPIPRATSLVLVITDAINHAMLRGIRERCQSADIPVVFSRSRKSELRQHLQSWWPPEALSA